MSEGPCSAHDVNVAELLRRAKLALQWEDLFTLEVLLDQFADRLGR